jgi:hypothetical protein
MFEEFLVETKESFVLLKLLFIVENSSVLINKHVIFERSFLAFFEEKIA